jgi:NTE family protein
LFLQGDDRLAEKTWLTMSPEKILSLRSGILLESLQQLGLRMKHTLLYQYANSLQGYGVFSRHGIIKLIEESLNLHSVASSNIPFYVTCYQLGRVKPQYFKMNGLTPAEIQQYLLATSAIPGIFPPEEIGGKLYFDGGLPLLGDNIPIEPLYKEGCNLIIVIPLDRSDVIDKRRYPKSTIIEILPQDSQGNFFKGTLQFTAAGAKHRIQQGYQDTKAVLEPVLRSFSAEEKFQQTAAQMVKEHQEFAYRHHEHNQRLSNQMNAFEKKLGRGKSE